ncbi:hypothetical protein ACFE04_011015 [Oxalis oulophora]
MGAVAQNFMDDIDCGSFFDQIDDLLDFPTEDNNDVVDAELTQSESSSLPVWQTQPESIAVSDSVFSVNNTASYLSADLAVPYEDIVHLEWLSTFCEESFNGEGLTMTKENHTTTTINNNEPSRSNQFQTSSPVSVLESSSSCLTDKTSHQSSHVVIVAGPTGKRGRARSKRPRPATFTPRSAINLISPSDSESFAESRLVIKIPKRVRDPEENKNKKNKKVRLSIPCNPEDVNQTSAPQTGVRKCQHCEITKTPQWRAGPMGPKTLCNACGVRYKSGRLFPEYRPAASPTFVPSLHSNSHKKVVEMRNSATMMTEFYTNDNELGYV